VVIASNPPIGGQGDWLLDVVRALARPGVPASGQAGRAALALHARGRLDRLGRRARQHLIDGLPLLALSCTFIPARLDDNRFLRDTDYRKQLMNLPEPLRSKLLNGDFLAGRADAPSQVIPWAWIEGAQKVWTPDGAQGLKMTTLGVDVAQGGADETVLVALHGTWFATPVRRRGVDTSNGPAVAGLVIEVMRDGCQVNIDLTGGWGGSARDHLLALGIRVEPVVFSQARARAPGRTAHLRQQAPSCCGSSARRSTGAGRRHRAAARPRLAAQLAGADLDAARQRDPDREQGRDPQAARHVDRRRRRRDPRLAPARRRAAAADPAAAQSGAVTRRMDGGCERKSTNRNCGGSLRKTWR
jgi:hypothetical protein